MFNHSIKFLSLAACAPVIFSASIAFAAPKTSHTTTASEKKELTAQQHKMGTCNTEAKTKALKGEARKTFMKECLSTDTTTTAAVTTPQERMKTCNKDAAAKSLKGEARKTFMSECLKSDHA